MAARHPDRRRRRGRQLHRQLPEPVIGHARRALHRSANHSGAAAKVASRRSGGRGLPSRLSHSGVRPSHQPPAAVPWHSLSSPESRRQRDRTRDRCSAATEYRGTRRDSRPLRLWQWHRRTESGQNPAPVRGRPRWSSRIPTRIAHGFGHEHARVFMEAIGDRAAVPRWRSPHRTPCITASPPTVSGARRRSPIPVASNDVWTSTGARRYRGTVAGPPPPIVVTRRRGLYPSLFRACVVHGIRDVYRSWTDFHDGLIQHDRRVARLFRACVVHGIRDVYRSWTDFHHGLIQHDRRVARLGCPVILTRGLTGRCPQEPCA